MKVLIAGPSGVHLQNYCRMIQPFVSGMVVVTETPEHIPAADRHEIIRFREFNPFQWVVNRNRLSALIKEENPAVIHVHQINRLAFMLVSVSGNTPIVATAWGSDILQVPDRNFIYRYLVRTVLKKSRYITADAQSMIERMHSIVPGRGEKYILVPYGIRPVWPGKKENIFYSNRLHQPLYNIDRILKKFSEFSRKHPEYTLRVAGEGPETEHLRKLAVSLGIDQQTTFLGWLDDERNRAEYARAKFFLSIPSSDGTSVSLLEAMSAGCIPIVSDIPSNREWIQDGVNGIILKENGDLEPGLGISSDRCINANQELIKKRADQSHTVQVFNNLYKRAAVQ